MPKRLVDGDAIWRSKKFLKVPVEFRAEYANLIPLAEANGVFDADPDSIWSDVYSFNRPDITKEKVVHLLNSFKAADLLKTWKQGGKTWGYWVGIDKPGRLPSPSAVSRGDYHLTVPDPPWKTNVENEEVTSDLPHVENMDIPCDHTPTIGIGIGIGLGVGIGSGKGSRLSKSGSVELEIKARVLSAYGKVDKDRSYIRGLKELSKSFGLQAVLNAFDTWASINPQYSGSSPVATFLRAAPGILNSGASKPMSPESKQLLQGVTDKIALLSNNDVVFTNAQLPILYAACQGYTPDEVIEAFKDFYDRITDDYDRKWAAKNFIEQGTQFLRTRKLRKEEYAKQQEIIARQEKQMQEEVAKDEIELEPEIVDDDFGKV